MTGISWANRISAVKHRSNPAYSGLTLHEMAALENAYQTMRNGPLGNIPSKQEDKVAHEQAKQEIRSDLAKALKKKKGLGGVTKSQNRRKSNAKKSSTPKQSAEHPKTIDEMLA